MAGSRCVAQIVYNSKYFLQIDTMSNSTTCFFLESFSFLCDAINDPLKYSSYSIIFASMFVIVALSPVAVVGNSLILAAIWKKTFDRSSFHILLSALALIDLLSGLVSQPLIGISILVLLLNPTIFTHQTALLSALLVIGNSSGIFLSGSTICILTFMSVERWLHMARRSLMTPQRRCFAITVLLLSQIPAAALAAVNILKGNFRQEVEITIAVSMLLCYLITSFSYFKVFQVIRQHQHQVQGNQSCENVAQPAINLAKYKKSVMTILHILALFSISILPMIVSLTVLAYKGVNLQTMSSFYVAWCF